MSMTFANAPQIWVILLLWKQSVQFLLLPGIHTPHGDIDIAELTTVVQDGGNKTKPHKGGRDTERRKPGSGGRGAGCRSRTARKEMDGPHETE